MNTQESMDRQQPRSSAASLKRCGRVCAQLGVFAMLLSAGRIVAPQNSQPQPSSGSAEPQGGPGRAWATSPQIAIAEVHPDVRNGEAANVERRKQIADDSARLLKMATELKAEVDKTTKDTLSLSVIRKADEIEKLAHAVKEKMKLAPASK
jgi:hypothetical protein